MASINKVILVGNLGADPEVRCEFKEATEWHRVSFFGRLAEIVSEYLKKGSSAYIEGRIRSRKWQAQDGTDRYSTEIVADQMQMLGGRNGGERRESAGDDGLEQGARSTQPRRGSSASDARNGRGASSATVRNRVKSSPPAQTGSGGFADLEDDIPFRQAFARAAWSAI